MYKVRFHTTHHSLPLRVVNNYKKVRYVSDETTCEISWREKKEDPWRVIDTGVSQCSVNDFFNGKFGRKLALERAVEELPKAERTKVWQTAFPMRGVRRLVTGEGSKVPVEVKGLGERLKAAAAKMVAQSQPPYTNM